MSGQGIRADFTVTEPADGAAAPSRDQVLISKAQNDYRIWVQRAGRPARRPDGALRGGVPEGRRRPCPRALPRRPHALGGDRDRRGVLRRPRPQDRRAARPTSSQGQKWTGWHRIEKDLWPERAQGYTPLTPAQRKAYGADLLANVTEVRDRIRDLTFTTDQIANGSSGLMEEVATGKVTGEEEYWSHTDLWDFAANVKGAQVAFEDVKPILERRDPALAKTLDAPVRRPRPSARPAPRGRRLRALHRPHPGRGQAAGRRGERPVRAAVPPDRGRPAVSEGQLRGLAPRPDRGRGRGRRSRYGVRGRRLGGSRLRRRGRRGARQHVVPLPRGAPGRDRHAGAGPAALRRVRRHHRVPGGAGRACCSSGRPRPSG